jgi:hypothetical protein
MPTDFVLFLFSLVLAHLSIGLVRSGAYQTPAAPYKLASVAAVHRSNSKSRHRVQHDASVTALLCREFAGWFIRGVHLIGRTMSLMAEARGNRFPPSQL